MKWTDIVKLIVAIIQIALLVIIIILAADAVSNLGMAEGDGHIVARYLEVP